jgi:hypothetical protein
VTATGAPAMNTKKKTINIIQSIILNALLLPSGMAVANGRLYLSTMDGKVRCFAGTGATK